MMVDIQTINVALRKNVIVLDGLWYCFEYFYEDTTGWVLLSYYLSLREKKSMGSFNFLFFFGI